MTTKTLLVATASMTAVAHAFVPSSLPSRPVVVPSRGVPFVTPAQQPPARRLPAVAVLPPDASMLLAQTAADFEFSGSYASLYATLGLYMLSFPGLISLVKRSVKVQMDQKTYAMPGPSSDSADAKPLRQVAAEIMAYMQANQYKVVEAGETIVFKGVVERSTSQAFFLSFCTFIGMATLALVLQIQVPKIGPIEIGSYWFLSTLVAPYAGVYYWQNNQKEDEVRIRIETSDSETETEVTVQASKEELEKFAMTMDYNEKGMIRVRGLLEQPAKSS